MCAVQKNWPKRKPRSKAGPLAMPQLQREEEGEEEREANWSRDGAVCTPSALPAVLQQ